MTVTATQTDEPGNLGTALPTGAQGPASIALSNVASNVVSNVASSVVGNEGSSSNSALSLITSTSTPGSPITAVSPSATSSSVAAVNNSSSSNNTGYIAGIGVLGGLLAISLLLIALLYFRRRKKSPSQEYDASAESKAVHDPNDNGLEQEIIVLKRDLGQKEAQLRETQAALLSSGRRTGASGLDDKHVNGQFAMLSQSINDWVVTHFKKMITGASAPEATAILKRVIPNYARLLEDPRTKFVVIRGLVAEMLVQAFNTDEFFGNEGYSHFKDKILANSSIAEANEWRALTVTLMESNTEYRASRSAVVKEVTKKIEYATANLAGLEYSKSRDEQLHRVVESAANLALTLGKQRTLFKVEMPVSGAFDAAIMEDVMQERRGDVLQGKPIQGVIFPSVTKYGGDSSHSYERGLVISRALVLV